MEVIDMLNDREAKVCRLLSIGTTITDIAKELKVTRQTIYDWKKKEELKARIDELGQDYLSATKMSVTSYGVHAVRILKDLAENSESEKIRLDAVSKLLDKVISNAVKIDIESTTDTRDTVTVDVLSKELEDIDSE